MFAVKIKMRAGFICSKKLDAPPVFLLSKILKVTRGKDKNKDGDVYKYVKVLMSKIISSHFIKTK